MADDESDEQQMYRRAEAVLDEVLDLPAAHRPAAVAAACGGDDRLRARVEVLVAALDRADRFLADPAAAVDRPEVAPVTERPGTVIGRYRLLDEIGQGGFGVVFRAEQTEPVRREVALKVVKLGMDTREVVARFEAERQALALMDHPNIAKVFDAGSTDAGRPYFVMELVRGLPITAYADRHRLTAAQRVGLLAAVCRAVQHAHGKGVIHRDLKPTNVLVADHDGAAVPKVIDFGIAKATQSTRLTDRTVYTGARQLIGTPQYMSPEQADTDGADVDTRTDVYSLGVLMYELLTGTTPHDARALRSAAGDAMRRMIRDQDPARPSTRLSSIGDAVADVAANRGTDPKRLGQLVRGELDWIVMRALEKDRSRRYETAAALADDLGRYAAGEAVLAGPVGGAYRVRTFARRHRAAIGVTAVVAASLLAGMAGTTWGLVRATRLRHLADAQRHLAEDRQGEADRARAVAESESDRAQAEVAFLADVMDRAKPASMPDRAVRDRVVHDMIEPVAAGIGDRFADLPLAEMQVRYKMGELYEALGRVDLAVPMLRRASELAGPPLISPDSAEALNGRLEYAHALQLAGRPADAEPLARSAVADLRRVFGPDDARTVRAGLSLAMVLADLNRMGDAIPLVRQGYDQARRTPGPDAPAALDAACLLADFLRRAGRFADGEAVAADAHARAVRTLGPDALITGSTAFLDGQLLLSLPRYADAEPLLAGVCEHNHRVLGDDNPSTLSTDNALATAHLICGRVAEAVALFKQTWDRARPRLGDDHPVTLAAGSGYAVALGRAGRWAEAEPLARDLVDRWRRSAGGDDREATIKAAVTLAQTLHGLGRDADAEPLARDGVARARRTVGDDHLLTAVAMSTEAAILHGLGRDREAEPLAGAAWRRTRATLGDGHPYTAQRRQVYADVLRALGRGAEAATLPATAPSTRP